MRSSFWMFVYCACGTHASNQYINWITWCWLCFARFENHGWFHRLWELVVIAARTAAITVLDLGSQSISFRTLANTNTEQSVWKFVLGLFLVCFMEGVFLIEKKTDKCECMKWLKTLPLILGHYIDFFFKAWDLQEVWKPL